MGRWAGIRAPGYPGAGALKLRALAQPASVFPPETRGLPGVRPAVLTAPVAPVPLAHRRAPRETRGNRKLERGSRTENAGTPARVRQHQDDPSPSAGLPLAGADSSAQVRAAGRCCGGRGQGGDSQSPRLPWGRDGAVVAWETRSPHSCPAGCRAGERRLVRAELLGLLWLRTPPPASVSHQGTGPQGCLHATGGERAARHLNSHYLVSSGPGSSVIFLQNLFYFRGSTYLTLVLASFSSFSMVNIFSAVYSIIPIFLGFSYIPLFAPIVSPS